MMHHFQLEWVKCGKAACRSCPHGPYLYEYSTVDGKRHKRYVGRKGANSLYMELLQQRLLAKKRCPYWYLLGLIGCHSNDSPRVCRKKYRALGKLLKSSKRKDALERLQLAAFAYVALFPYFEAKKPERTRG